MRKIIASINIDSNSIKLVVGEFNQGRLHILSTSKVNVKHDEDKDKFNANLIEAIKEAKEKSSLALGLEITKVVLSIDSRNLRLVKAATAIKIKHIDEGEINHIINGYDIDKIFDSITFDKVPEKYALTSIIPVEFIIDEDKIVEEPVGIESENLGLKAILVLSPKEYVQNMLNIVNAAGLKVIDVVPTSLGDYNCFKNKTTKESIGAIVNIGYDETCISIFNKGILTNSKCFPIGEKSVIRDIAFVKNLKFDVAKGVYKKIALANTKLSNKNEFVIAVDNDENKIKLEQFDVSEIAVSRIEEILELVKKQINILTKKQISYIIITGALTELKDFSITLESVLGKNAYLGKLKIIGARDNNYVSAIGVIKYFNNQLKLKNRNFSIFSEDELEEMNNLGKESSDNKNSLVNKVFGYFFDS